MNAFEHLIEIPEITMESIASTCIDIMLDVECFELPVKRDGQLYGSINMDDCLVDTDKAIKDLVQPGFPTVFVNNHLIDVMRVFRETKSSTCAVINEEREMLGIITKEMVINKISHSITVEQVGAILVLETVSHQYSSSEIARIVEGENSQILGMWLENVPDSGRIRISLKLNTSNSERIVNSLTRFNYEVIAIFGDISYHENVDRRYKSLMKYLDI